MNYRTCARKAPGLPTGLSWDEDAKLASCGDFSS